MSDTGLQKDSAAWLFFVRACFVLAVLSMTLGIYFVPSNLWVKGYLWMGQLFVMGSAITLTKTLRDDHEARKLINQINEVKTEKILREFDG